MFARFEQRWTFDPLAEGGTDIRYHVDFRFKSLLLQTLMDVAFADRASAIITAIHPACAPSLWRVGEERSRSVRRWKDKVRSIQDMIRSIGLCRLKEAE